MAIVKSLLGSTANNDAHAIQVHLRALVNQPEKRLVLHRDTKQENQSQRSNILPNCCLHIHDHTKIYTQFHSSKFNTTMYQNSASQGAFASLRAVI